MAWYNDVDTTKKFRLGSVKRDVANNVYVYCSGAASLAAGNWVVFDEAYAVTRLVASEVGPVGIAMGDFDSTTKYGWVQTYGVNTSAKTDTVAADKGLWATARAGEASDSDVTIDSIVGAFSMTADTAGVTTVFLCFPHVEARALD